MWYAKIEDNQVIKIKEFDGPDPVLEPKLLSHGYRIGEDGDSSYDPQIHVQSSIPDYDVQESKVVRTYFIALTSSLVDYGKVEGDEVTNIEQNVFEPTVIAGLLADGYKVIEEGDSPYDPLTQTITTEATYDIQATKLVRTYVVNDKPLDQCKLLILAQVNQEVNTYINTYYDTGTQQSFTAAYVKYNTPELKAYLDPIWDWIEIIMSYYYTVKQLIVDAETIETLKNISWDFGQFDDTNPTVSLKDLIQMISS